MSGVYSEDKDLIGALAQRANIPYKDGKVNIDGADVEFNTLPVDEQAAILFPQNGDDDTNLDEDEVELINQLRESGLGVQDFFDNYKNVAIDEFKSQLEESKTNIDSMGDDDVFIYDTRARLGENATDEDVKAALITAKSNPDLYAKTIAGLRNEYKEYEQNQKKADEDASKERMSKEEEVQYNIYKNKLSDTMNDIHDVIGVELDDNEKEAILKSIIEVDKDGNTEFDRALQDPRNFIMAAAIVKYGPQMAGIINETYNKALANNGIGVDTSKGNDVGSMEYGIEKTPEEKGIIDINAV